MDQLALLQQVVREPAAARARLDGIDLGAFLPPRPWRLRFLLRQLRWRSPIFRYALRLSAAMLAARSEEHTSELQSLMRISYAVFCLKKKKTIVYSAQLLQEHLCHLVTPLHLFCPSHLLQHKIN